jgi:hypothetical protein
VQEAIFADGVPAKITVADFRRFHLQSFPKLADEKYDGLIADAIEAVYAMFKGVATAWEMYAGQVWYEKTVQCYRFLTAWYICDVYPGLVSGVPTMGGIPLKRKKIGGVDITFQDNDAGKGSKDYLDLLASLKSNPFGAKAYLMIQNSPKRFMLWNSKVV